ncbi:MAG: phosphoenolpyruvate carboxykinase [Candidatus Lokiarchaeota archaeon]|nr:phosphoenolpyruvate carboxykinase [Candidatus Lokiarchaeota archaeon]
MTYPDVKIIDEEMRNSLLKLAERYLGYDTLNIWNANLNGYIIQLRTNDYLIEDFWVESWFPEDIRKRPHGIIFVVTEIPNQEPGVYYDPKSNTGIIFNHRDYFITRSLAIGMIADITEDVDDLHFLRGSLVDVDGEGICIMSKSYTEIATHTFQLLEMDKARIHSSDLIYVEQLGGTKGRISTLAPERKFYVKSSIIEINPRIKVLFERCKKDLKHFILNPSWIEGSTKYIDTTRIKLVILLRSNGSSETKFKRLTPLEAIELLANDDPPFLDPNTIVLNNVKIEKRKKFFSKIFQFAACYEINSSNELFEVQSIIRNLITHKDYLKPIEERKVVPFDPQELINKLDIDKLKQAVVSLDSQSNVKFPKQHEIKKMAEKYGTKTKFGNYNFVSTVKNRSAPLTVYIGSPEVTIREMTAARREIFKNLSKTIEDVMNYMKKTEFIGTKRRMGENQYFTPICHVYHSIHRKEMVRLSHMVNKSLFDLPEIINKEISPDIYIVHIPEWQEKDRQILVFPEHNMTFVLGSDYYGEDKKGLLRMAMWIAKKQGMLGLHAGAKTIKARNAKSSKLNTYNCIIFGLTATGKTTHSTHTHDLDEADGESITIVQDDFVALRDDGSAIGTERGFFLKTDSVDPQIHPLIYKAVTEPDAIFENVLVDYRGNIFFQDETLTGNGRGIMQRTAFGKYMNPSINLAPLDQVDGLIILLITRRNTIVPVCAKLTIEQAALAFMLGESIHTSGSDPKRAGESIRTVGTNPFIIGDEAQEANMFYEILKKHENKIRCFQINTGGVGEIMETDEEGNKIHKRKVERIQIKEMASIIRGIARESITWKDEDDFGTKIPVNIEGMDISKYDPKLVYDKETYEKLVKELKDERRKFLEKYPNLDQFIKNALKLD